MRIDAYFKYIQGEYSIEKPEIKKSAGREQVKQKAYDREPEPPTIAGLALFLGFSSIEEFDAYENTGKFSIHIKRARLRVTEAYEKKLHQQPSGAIFALKSMGWHEKAENTSIGNETKTICIKIIETGPKPVSSEKEIIL